MSDNDSAGLSPVTRAIADRFREIGRMRIEVPEWPPGVFFAEPYTLRDERMLGRMIAENNPEGWADLLILKLQNEGGKAVFTKADKPALMRFAEAHVLKRAAMQIMASVSSPDVEKKD